MLRNTIEDFLGIKKLKKSDEPNNELKLKRLLEVEILNDSIKEIVYTKRQEPVLLVKPNHEYDYNYPETYKLFTFTFGQLECFKIHFDLYKDEIEIIDVVVIREEFHNKGYGTLLIQEVIKHGKDIGVKRIFGSMVNDSGEHHQRQMSFYSRNGFSLYGNNHKFEMVFY